MTLQLPDPSNFRPLVNKGDEPVEDFKLEAMLDQALRNAVPPKLTNRLLSTNPQAAAAIGAGGAMVEDATWANNAFNKELRVYKDAQARLAEYVRSEGRAEVTEAQWQSRVHKVFNRQGVQQGFAESFSAIHEREADEIGLLYSTLAGYDPNAGRDLWAKKAVSRQVAYRYFSTHPADAERANANVGLI